MKNSKFGLKNFRVFDEKGAEFEMAPITIITGANSSGKSSVFKSLMLLNETLGKSVSGYISKKEYNPSDMRLEFHKGKHNLGTYAKAKSNFSESESMIFSFERYSDLIMSDVKINLYFSMDEEDFLKNGRIDKIEMFQAEKQIFGFYFDHNSRDITVNMDVYDLKEHFVSLFTTRKDLIEKLMERVGSSSDYSSSLHSDYFDSEESMNSFFENEKDRLQVNRFINAKNNILDIDNCRRLVEFSYNTTYEHLNYDNLSQLIYLPFDKLIDTDKDNIVESFDRIISDRISENVLSEDEVKASIDVCKSFMTLSL